MRRRESPPPPPGDEPPSHFDWHQWEDPTDPPSEAFLDDVSLRRVRRFLDARFLWNEKRRAAGLPYQPLGSSG
jgi:hypothetical protein